MPANKFYKKDQDKPFVADPSKSHTLPARYFYDQDIFEQEKAAIFYKNWVYVCHRSRVAKPGDYVTELVHDQNVIIVKGRDEKIRAFHNVCQHRGHELLKGCGKAQMIVCPYHAWTYDLDGTLRAARETGSIEDFDKSEFSLKEVALEEFCGMVFVNLDGQAVPLREQAPELEKEIRSYVPNADDLVYADCQEFQPQANWKILVENFQECYHCAVAHKDFSVLVDFGDEAYNPYSNGIFTSHCSTRTTRDSAAYQVSGNDIDGYGGWFLWPNLTIWVYPGEEQLSVMRVDPLTPTTSYERHDWFTKDGTVSEELEGTIKFQRDTLQYAEDIPICENVQRGLKSIGYNQGRFVVGGDRVQATEAPVHHFQSLVVNALGLKIGVE